MSGSHPVAEPRVCVITPLYNGEKFLAECIESVLSQTYSNWEHVIVDNRSDDASVRIAESFACKDGRIRIVEANEHLDAIPNWNRAMRHVADCSRYCKVVHADDQLLPECLSRMVAHAERHPAVGIVGAYSLYGDRVILDGLGISESVLSGREICRRTLLGRVDVFGSPTATLLRAELVRERDPFYPEDEIHADTAVCYEILDEWDFGFVHQVLTHSRKHEGSRTSKIARRLHTYRTGRLSNLKKYGPRYLEEDEYRERLDEALDEHYRFLAQRILRRRQDRHFWDHHTNELERIGEPLRRSKLIRTWLAFLARRVLNPEATLRGQIRTRLGGGADAA